jgi:hypothetical protein
VFDAIFNRVPPVKPDQVLGDWNGGFFDTRHPVAKTLDEIRWVGKPLKSIVDVDPIIVDKNGERVRWEK